MDALVNDMLYQYSYYQVYFAVVLYFLLLYFGLGPFFLSICQLLEKAGLLNKIIDEPVAKKQVRFEVKYSLLSIVIFGFTAIPLIYLIRSEAISVLPNTWGNVLLGVLIMNVWNEVHFFIIHRLMHLPFFMKSVHHIHHRSRVPTVYSVYSFHGLESFLLGAVPLTIAPWVSFAPLVFAIYPLTSILLNYAGHCNYRFGSGDGDGWAQFGTKHNDHHARARQNFGFATDLLDRVYRRLVSKTNQKHT